MPLKNIVLILATIAAFPLGTPSVRAAEHTIVLHHMELEHITGTLRVGDTITFHNMSDMAHNLYITYADGTIDNLDTQFPDMKRSTTLRVTGAATVRCWIHPIIRADIDVLEPADE